VSDHIAARPYTNRLARETSPYLLQHAHNPVDWYPWGPEALARARTEEKPIFLSIGYAACHWCHVMERESFEDPETAALMNREFVAIKVDREERPDLDDLYLAAVQAMTGSGGWPLNVFLTTELQPFFGGTYFPPDDRHGTPSFPRVLAAVADAWHTRRAEVLSQGGMLADHLRAQLEVPPGIADPEGVQLEGAVARLAGSFDERNGGFGGAPKFPAPMTLEFLLRAWRRSGDPDVLRMVTTTLDRMAAGGMHDQLGGGFARYATDAIWLVPHFEKMLYDNAQLAHAYLEAYRVSGEERYRTVVASTLDFMLGELATPDGGLASALDADSEGEEGRFYVWSYDEFMAVLRDAAIDDAQARVLADYWGVTPEGNWEGRTVLSVSSQAPAAELLDMARSALLDARSRRVRPARDDKQIGAWNGLALRSLAEAGLTLGQDRYLQAAGALGAFVRGTLLREGDRLWRTARNGDAHTPAFLEDYACLADGFLALHGALGRADDLDLSRRLMERAVSDFWDDASGAFWDTSEEHDAVVARPRSLVDGATPSGNAVAADVLLKLALLTGEADLDRRARSILRVVAGALERQPTAFGRMLSVADRALATPLDAVIAAEPGDSAAHTLRRAAAQPYAPDLVIANVAAGDAIGSWAIFEGKLPRGGAATAFVCRGYACDEPTSDPARVTEQIRAMGQRR
jgi:uncharacterized protein YyaL (SSP411 family)